LQYSSVDSEARSTRLLDGSDGEAAVVTNSGAASPFLLLGDHAGRGIPAQLGDLGLSDVDLRRHIAWDIGVAGLGQILAERLDYPMATFAAIIEEEPGALKVSREVDGGVAVLRLRLPALVTVDLRIVAPTSVYSAKTDRSFKYNDGVRFAPLPAIMQAKKKRLDVKPLASLVPDTALRTHYRKFAPPPERKAGARVASVAELVNKLANEAKVI